MGSTVEVLHAFPINMNAAGAADHHQTSHHDSLHASSSRRSTSSHTPRSDASSSSASTARNIHGDDTPMTDVNSTTSHKSYQTVSSRRPFGIETRELAYHGPQNAGKANGSPTTTGTPSYNQSPTTVFDLPASTSSRTSNASSKSHSPHHAANNQSPRSNRSPPSPPRIKVKSLSHIQSFVIDDANPLASSRASSRLSLAGREITPQYEISEMPVAEIIEMVAGLLTKMTTTNDRQQSFLDAHPLPESEGLNMQTGSVMAFHGKNVPSISILSYLSRIHKYCPTTYEVFLSLLIYFDRMTERVNSGPKSLRQANEESMARHLARQAEEGVQTASQQTPAHHLGDPQSMTHDVSTPPSSGSSGRPKDAINNTSQSMPPSPPNPLDPSSASDPTNLNHFFVVDSFNIHRLVIAGVTCASKFFSDIFYTNSRYAKVSSLAQMVYRPRLLIFVVF